MLLQFPLHRRRRHARASVKTCFEQAATKASNVIPMTPRAEAAPVRADQYSTGIEPRAFQLLTTESPTPQMRATSDVPPRRSMIDSTSMEPKRTSRIVKMSRLHGKVKDTNRTTCFTNSMRRLTKPLTDMGFRMLQVRFMLEKNQKEMANEIGTTEGGWSDIERGKRPIAIERARVLYREHKISLDWTYEGDTGNLSKQRLQDLAEAKEKILAALREVRPNRTA